MPLSETGRMCQECGKQFTAPIDDPIEQCPDCQQPDATDQEQE